MANNPNTYAAILLTFATLFALGANGKDLMNDINEYHRFGIEGSDSTALTWQPINDGVMGGLSQSRLVRISDGTGAFEGTVSLANNGGFASIRAHIDTTDLSSYDGLAVRFRGDGKRYRIRLRTDQRFDGIAYQAQFESSAGKWETVEIPFSSFVPTFRGHTPVNAPPLNTAVICQLGFMIADKQEGPFRIEIAWVRAFRK
jgi:NADH dehydrogenase [ubiquinone] 1 alpha subcomplex assembly factor 1